LEVTLRGGATADMAEEERELSKAIIEATVDSYDDGSESTVLVKHLGDAPG
jgi:hypothetical protein